MIFPSAIILIHAICNGRYTSGNGLFWLGRDCDVQVPRAVQLGSQVSVAAASGLCAFLLGCQLGFCHPCRAGSWTH